MFNLTIYRFKINLLLYIEAQINYLRQLSAHSVNFIHISDDIIFDRKYDFRRVRSNINS